LGRSQVYLTIASVSVRKKSQIGAIAIENPDDIIQDFMMLPVPIQY
jgi:hypothetical protein